MRTPSLVVIAAYVIGGVICTEAHMGDRVYPIHEISDDDLMRIDVSDGSLDEWEEILGGHEMSPLEFLANVGKGMPPYDPADLDFRVWLAWNQTNSLLLCAVMVVDDDYIAQEYDDMFLSAGCDMVGLMVDGDHSGGQYAFGTWVDESERLNDNRTAQFFRAVPVAPDGRNLQYYGAGDDWVCRPPYADAGGSTQEGAPVSLWSVEFYVTPFDDLIWDSPETSRPSALYPGKIIGLDLTVADNDSEEGPGGFSIYALSPTWESSRKAQYFVDAILIGSVDTGSSVANVTWGRIKASFR